MGCVIRRGVKFLYRVSSSCGVYLSFSIIVGLFIRILRTSLISLQSGTLPGLEAVIVGLLIVSSKEKGLALDGNIAELEGRAALENNVAELGDSEDTIADLGGSYDTVADLGGSDDTVADLRGRDELDDGVAELRGLDDGVALLVTSREDLVASIAACLVALAFASVVANPFCSAANLAGCSAFCLSKRALLLISWFRLERGSPPFAPPFAKTNPAPPPFEGIARLRPPPLIATIAPPPDAGNIVSFGLYPLISTY